MLTIPFLIKPSLIPLAGKGLFNQNSVKKAQVLIVPNQHHTLYSAKELSRFAPESIEQASSVRWYEDMHTVDPEWSPESHLNHSFTPNCLWHLGFVFALQDISADSELTIDYAMLLDEHTKLDFLDSLTGREVRGISWPDKMRRSAMILQALFH